MPDRRLPTLVLAAAAILALSACGNDATPTGTGAPSTPTASAAVPAEGTPKVDAPAEGAPKADAPAEGAPKADAPAKDEDGKKSD